MEKHLTDPISVFNQAVAALEAEAWERAAALCDPATLSIFKRQLLERAATVYPSLTVEQFIRSNPGMPVEVARYHVAKHSEGQDPNRTLDEVPSVSSLEELRELSPVAVFAAWLDGRSHRRFVELAIRHQQVPPDVAAKILERPLGPTYRVIGAVNDGDHLVHVVYRRDYTSDEPAAGQEHQADLPENEVSAMRDQQKSWLVDHAALRKQPDGSWRLLAGHNFLGSGNSGLAFGFSPTEEEAQ